MSDDEERRVGDAWDGDIGAERSQEKQESNDAVFSDLKLGEAWGESITRGRAAELEGMLQAWEQEVDHGERRGPFDNVPLNGADVFWLAARTLAGSDDAQAVAEQMGRLRQAQHDSSLRLRLKLAPLHLVGANLREAHLARASLAETDLSRVDLFGADLRGADLYGVALSQAHLTTANLSDALLATANLSGADLEAANLSGADLSRATFDPMTNLTDVQLTDTPGWSTDLLRRLYLQPTYGAVIVADLHWNGADLTVTDWSGVRRLGDEYRIRWWAGIRRTPEESERATRAYAQLAQRLRDAGMTYDATRFAYRAQVCQRRIYLDRGRLVSWLFSWLLFVIAGYGYRPLRTLFWYLAVIFGFAAIYFSVGPGVGVPLSPLGSLVFSITSFHGRGFFPGGSPGHSVTLDDPLTVMAAMEAVVGLFIEISFIATFTQRFFGK